MHKESTLAFVGAHERAAKKGQPAAGWNEFPEELPREEVTLDVPESERGL